MRFTVRIGRGTTRNTLKTSDKKALSEVQRGKKKAKKKKKQFLSEGGSGQLERSCDFPGGEKVQATLIEGKNPVAYFKSRWRERKGLVLAFPVNQGGKRRLM